jgi:hypothetical protein
MRTLPDEATPQRRETASNTRLTAVTGMTLFVLLAVQGVTILRVRRLITLHFFLGFLLLGPVLLKLASAGYRFFRYYSGDPDYGRAGPPRPLLRLAAPVLIILTVAVFGSGVALAFATPGHTGSLLLIHKATFILWFGVTTLHVLAYLWRAVSLTVADIRGQGPSAVVARRGVRLGLVLASVGFGLLAGLLALGPAHTWSTWLGSRGH